MHRYLGLMTDDPVVLDPRLLRGLAHPLRVRLLELLRVDGRSTATRLAERLGQSSGATSYHLRQLAEYGFVEEDPEQGAGRERWWRAAHRSTTLDKDSGVTIAEAEGYMRAVAASYSARVARFLDSMTTLPAEWQANWTMSDSILQLTPEDVARLKEEIFALVQRYPRREPGVAGPEGSAPVAVQWNVLPDLGDAAAGNGPEGDAQGRQGFDLSEPRGDGTR
ncbi:transcriptional regulator [Longispora fulva]|nr:transcriptional regulator [Longispora fulva]